jgi:hypothetical protein
MINYICLFLSFLNLLFLIAIAGSLSKIISFFRDNNFNQIKTNNKNFELNDKDNWDGVRSSQNWDGVKNQN